jgi:hypothetical protein
MRNPNDNIDQRYAEFAREKGQSGIVAALTRINDYTEDSYDAFKEVVDDHAELGKAAIIMMIRNQASHLHKIATDTNTSKQEHLQKIYAIIAPMFSMLYDRYTEEKIEDIVNYVGEAEG